MKSGPSLASAMLLAALISSAPPVQAQTQNDPPPDLHMLLDLDLFKPNPNADVQNSARLPRAKRIGAVQVLRAAPAADLRTTSGIWRPGDRVMTAGRINLMRHLSFAAAVLGLAMLLGAFVPHPAYAQGFAPGQPRNAAEQALISQRADQWNALTPDQRERVLENYRQWKTMSPQQRNSVEQNFHQFRSLPPDQRQQVLRGMRQWRSLPPERREQLRQSYNHFKQLPPERRQQIMQRYQHFQQLPPQQRAHVMENYKRWQAMTPEQRSEVSRRFRSRQQKFEHREGEHPFKHN
jgi:predicted Fe-S protein YdhL (DUF1289 family)